MCVVQKCKCCKDEGIHFDDFICSILETSKTPTSSALETLVSDMTKCPICLEELVNPRTLPCLHSFCLRCLRSCCMNKGPGTKVPCPLCKGEVTLPENGPHGFPLNFHLRNLINARASGAETETQQEREPTLTGNDVHVVIDLMIKL